MATKPEGTPREIRWSWQSDSNDLRVGYMAVDGRMSITDLIGHMATVAPGVDPADIHINWSTVTWTRPANADELAQRQAAIAHHDARHEAWERETFARLLARYGPASGGDVSAGAAFDGPVLS